MTETIYDTAAGLGLGKPHTISFTHYQGDNTHTVTETYAYDSLGRSISTTTVLSGQVAFNGTYSSFTFYNSTAAPGYGRIAAIVDPGGFTRASVYNELGFLSELHEGSPSGTLLWKGIAYDAEGRVLEEEHGNGLGIRNSYHPTRGFVESSQTFRTATGAPVQQLELRVNDLGNVDWRRLTRFETAAGVSLGTPQRKVETFTYDSQNRLTASYVTGQTLQNVVYDANGNIVSKTGVGDYTYGQAAGPHAVTGVSIGGASRRYTYDARGRMAEEFYTPSGGSEILLREVVHNSFDQPQFIRHWGAAALSSDLDLLDDGLTPWDQICLLNFYFGPDLQRMIQTKVKGQLYTKTLSLGGYEIRETTRSGFGGPLVEKEERSHFGTGARVKRWTVTSPTIPLMVLEYSVSDHLGSDSVTYDGSGQVQMQRGNLKQGEVQESERQSYDAWGARRDAENWVPAPGQLPVAQSPQPEGERPGSNLARGFTGHEMLDDVGLIHMNGRLYDPALGRMCAADPYVQTPENIQNYNRYSYALNNPLSQIDPSGHIIVGIIAALATAIVGLIGAIITTVVAFVAYLAVLAAQFVVTVISAVGQAFGAIGNALYSAAKAGLTTVKGLLVGGTATAGGGTAAGATAAGGGLTAGKVMAGAALGASYNGIQAAVNGGGLSDILKAAATGAATGAVGAVVGAGMHGLGDAVGSMMQKGGESLMGTIVHLAAHGAAGGGMSEAMGGNFKDGFIGGLIGAGVSGVFGRSFSGLSEGIGILGRTAVASVSGGVASALAGGKFADGAFAGAFFHLFNNEINRWWAAGQLRNKRIGALVDWRDKGIQTQLGQTNTGHDFRGMADFLQAQQINIGDPNWRDVMAGMVENRGKFDVIYVIDHGRSGYQQFGVTGMSNSNWDFVTSNLTDGGTVVLLGCNVAEGVLGRNYLLDLARAAHRNSSAARVVGYTGTMNNHFRQATGDQISTEYTGAGDYTLHKIKGTNY
jgi:RHS repeat-associated protein